MSSIFKDLGIDLLSLDQRLDLIHEIWESISAEGGQDRISEARRNELETRLAEHIASPDDVVPWEQIKAEAERKSRVEESDE